MTSVGKGYLSGREGLPLVADEACSLPTPEPAAGLAAYRQERELALAADPRRRANYERYQASRFSRAELDYLPIKMDIENVSRCNFRCTMCQVSDWDKGKRADDLPLETFKHLIDQQYGLIEIKLQGMGEPLLQRDDFFEMIRYARRSHIWVRTTTNASLLHVRDNYRKLIDADPNEVQISIDGATKEVFEGVRRGAVFEQVSENCAAINRYCREKGVERTKMWVVLQEANIGQMEALLELAARLGFTNMAYSLNMTDWGQSVWNARNAAVAVDQSIDLERCRQAVERGAELGVRVGFWSVTSKYDASAPETRCPWPFERAYVSSDGRVVPCCTIANPDALELGGAADFTATWNGEDYRVFRQAHIDGALPVLCRGCYQS